MRRCWSWLKWSFANCLSNYEFPGDDTPIIAGSALMALNGEDDNELGVTAVKKLVEALDNYIPEPERAC